MFATTTKERLQKYAKHKFGEYKVMEDKCGLTHGILSYPSEPNVRVLQKVLQKCPDLSADWLILGIGPMERYTTNNNNNNNNKEENHDSNLQLAEPTQPYQGKQKDGMVTVPSSILQALQQQLENKDAQIATLLEILNSK